MWPHLMGLNSNVTWYTITIWFIILQTSCFTTFSLPMNHTTKTPQINPKKLHDYLYNYSLRSISNRRPHTGVLLNVSLPSNFSGIRVSIVRLRSTTLWDKGANFNTFDIPPKVIKIKHVTRYAIMYENLGNMSSYYYTLPGYKILSSIVGITIYNATDFNRTTNPQRLNITISGQPIKVRFSNNRKNFKNVTCVRFDPINGLIVLSKMSRPNVCLTRSLGQFGIAIPIVNVPEKSPVSPPPAPATRYPDHYRSNLLKDLKFALWKKWLIGFIIAFMALMLLVSCSVLFFKSYRIRKMAIMEKKAEKSESLETRWIGTSKMPSASVTRTQAVLENDLAP